MQSCSSKDQTSNQWVCKQDGEVGMTSTISKSTVVNPCPAISIPGDFIYMCLNGYIGFIENSFDPDQLFSSEASQSRS